MRFTNWNFAQVHKNQDNTQARALQVVRMVHSTAMAGLLQDGKCKYQHHIPLPSPTFFSSNFRQ